MKRVYDLVTQDPGVTLDAKSEAIHGISVSATQQWGRDLRTVLTNLTDCIQQYSVQSLIAHDIVADLTLLVNEAVRCGLSPSVFMPVQTLFCTKLAPGCYRRLSHTNKSCDDSRIPTVALCAIPMVRNHSSWKWPKLKECFQVCVMGNDERNKNQLTKVHDPREDVDMCRCIFEQIAGD